MHNNNDNNNNIIIIAPLHAGEDDWKTVCQELQSHAAKWKKVAQALGIRAVMIDEIEENNNRNASLCLDKAIQSWIDLDYNTNKHDLPSWRSLCKAISNVSGMKRTFKNLSKKYTGIIIIV